MVDDHEADPLALRTIDALYFQAADPAFDPVRDTEMMLLIVSRALQPAAGRRSGAAT